MSQFTKQEIEAEHRRRNGPKQTVKRSPIVGERYVCIHCGHPLSYSLPQDQEAGLCDSCESQDS